MPNARPLLAAVFGLAAAAATLPAQQHDYVVLAACADGDAFDRAARHLERHHRALLLRFDPGELAGVAEALAAAAPRHVALVMRPEQIDFGFQRRFLQLATRIDDDPFVDFAFGYITGATGDEALALAERGTARQPKVGTPRFAGVAGGVDRSRQFDVPVPMGKVVVRQLGIHSAGEQAFPDEGRDRAFLAEHLPKLEGCDVVTFIGHGYPHEVHGGPDHRDIRGLRLPGAVALNVACYTGTTDRWYDRDHRRARIVAKRVPGEQSFCLELLRSGVVGYTAYVCPRPAGPELDTDRTALVFDGATLGEARRRDYDKTVLGFLGFGEERLALDDVHDGAKVPRAIDPIRDLMLEGATGGALFGDPACRPFAGMPDKSPVRVAVEAADEAGDEHVTVRVKGDAGVLWTHFSDPTARWGDSMAMKVHARVPLGDRHATGVEVRELRVGRKVVPTRLLWAVEEDHGERFVQVRVNFERSLKVRGVLSCTVRVATTADASQAVRRGGEVQRPQRGGAGNQAPPKGDPFVLAAERDVPREAVEAAIAASGAALRGRADLQEKLDALGAFGEHGFEATLSLLECGRSHYRMWMLLRATWKPGLERRLIALASGPPLPNFASWSVLHGLGVADTPEVRAFLLARLESEQDAGLWMSAAQGLTLLGARECAATIGARILEFRAAWNGVEPHLIGALGALGGGDAVAQLEKIAAHPSCKNWKSALGHLQRLDPAAADRVREARDAR